MRTWAAILALCLSVPLPVQAASDILAASYADPTERYDHGVLGDEIEYGTLVFSVDVCAECARVKWGTAKIVLPANRVFEDLEPRLVDLDNDGFNEVMVIESDIKLGARLAIYDLSGLVTATPFLGRSHRWLAPAGAADLDGDGRMEVAYVEKPHLARELKIWRYVDRKLVFVTSAGGLTNHRIGEDYISGGIRKCSGHPEVITADARWRRIIASRLVDGKLVAEDIGAFAGKASMKKAMECR